MEQANAVAPGVYGVIGGAVNLYVVDDSESGVTVIDAGLPRGERPVLALLEQIRRTPADVRQILITHADFDHVGGLKGLVRETGAPVYASSATALHLRQRSAPKHLAQPVATFAALAGKLMLRRVPVAHEVTDGDVLDIAGGIRVIATPGHTLDHVSYYWEQAGVLFVGDLLNNRDGLRLTPPRITADTAAARRSARRILDLEPAVLCMGHGPVVRTAEARDQLEALRARMNA